LPKVSSVQEVWTKPDVLLHERKISRHEIAKINAKARATDTPRFCVRKGEKRADDKFEEGVVLSEDQVAKYFEVRLRSLAIMAVAVVALFIFLFFLFVWRGQYLYAAVMIGLVIIVALAAAKLPGYARLFRKSKMKSARDASKYVNSSAYTWLQLSLMMRNCSFCWVG